MDKVEIDGVKTVITVRRVAGGKRWTWEFHCENGISDRNTEELCPSRAVAWDEAVSWARQAIALSKKGG